MEFKLSKILRGAIYQIKRKGHNKGEVFDPSTGAFCALGPIEQSNEELGDSRTHTFVAACNEMMADIRRLTDFNCVSAFNDAEETTRTDVLRMMGTTARRLEKEGR